MKAFSTKSGDPGKCEHGLWLPTPGKGGEHLIH